MIRLATASDISGIYDLISEFLQNTAYTEHSTELNEQHLKKLVYASLHLGKIWLYEEDSQAQGLLIAIKEQNLWMPDKHSLRELVWYVRPQYRHKPSAARLFVEFCREGEKMLNNKEINGYFTTRMSTTTDYDLTKRGFREVERLFLKDN
jgi:hypothetical protein